MERALAILALTGGILATLAGILLTGPVLAIIGLVALATSVFCFIERTPLAIVGGLALVVVAIFSILAVLGGVSTENTQAGNFDPTTGHALAVTAGMAMVVVFVAIRREEIVPEWIGYAGVGAAAFAIIMAFAFKTSLGAVDGSAFVVGIFALLASVAPGWALRG